MLSAFTLLFEVVLVPLALVLPPALRCHIPLHMIMLHFGIGAAQSAGIGAAFLPNAASYFLGMGSAACAFAPPSDEDDPLAPLMRCVRGWVGG